MFSRDSRVSDHPAYLSTEQIEEQCKGLPSTAMSMKSGRSDARLDYFRRLHYLAWPQ
jgi:hypothetical protein